MGRATTKKALIESTEMRYRELINLLNSISIKNINKEFAFNVSEKKEAHWHRDKNIRDVICHLYHWHVMFYNWYQKGLDGSMFKTPSEIYGWRDLPKLNMDIHKLYQNTTYEEASKLLEEAYQSSFSLLQNLNEEQLFQKGYYPWTKTSHLASYFIANGPSHYIWAIKKIKKHLLTP